MTELRSSWQVGQSVVCTVTLVWQIVYEIGMFVACYVYHTCSIMITTVAIIITTVI